MFVCRAFFEIFSVKEWHDLETRSLIMALFDRLSIGRPL